MITSLHIGGKTYKKIDGTLAVQNSFRNINAILGKLGINSSPAPFHHNHFHIYLKPPALQALPTNLLADALGSSTSPTASAPDAQALSDYAQIQTIGDELMFTMDIPSVPVQEASWVLAQAPVANVTPAVDFLFKACEETQPTPEQPRSAMRAILPAHMLANYYASRSKEIKLEDIKTTPLQVPKHGELKAEVDNTGITSYRYDPAPGFLGNDQAIFLATYGGKRYKIILDIKVLYVVDERSSTCPDPTLIRVKKVSYVPNPGAETTDLAAWQRASELSALIADASQSLTGFSDLASTALGQTTGEGASAQITLDTNAAGHNWYIDPTPLDNSDDYLPTSDASVWKAKAGSEAAGKMDMLSVLLHEYGHALGLEHSGAASDFMAASLQPGVRKLPSAAELTLMSQLVAELKNAGGETLTLALSQGERGQVQGESEQDPSNPSSPLPSPSPLSALGLLPFGLMRRNDGKGSANTALTAGAPVHTDYLTAINTTLANGSFTAGQNGTIDQWESVGNVATAPAAAFQAVTLGESTTAQAHLGQAFVLSAQDRFLTFTVSGLNLQSNSIEQNGVFTAAPQDAFEVALQNANTGANLLANGAGGVGNYPF